MPNKCVYSYKAFGCSTGYDKKKSEPTVCDENSVTFHFPLREKKIIGEMDTLCWLINKIGSQLQHQCSANNISKKILLNAEREQLWIGNWILFRLL